MKVKASYNKQSLGPLLTLSFVGHAIVFTVSAFLNPAPDYAVVKAPSSMEIVLLEEPKTKKKEEKVIEGKVLTASEAESIVHQEEAKIVKETEEEISKIQKDIPQPMIAPPEKGAVKESEPAYLRNPAPVYPKIARQRGWEGLVMLRVYVDRLGIPVQVQVKRTSGHRELDAAAINAVQKWKFKPASLGDHTFSVWIDIPVRFILEK